MTYEFAEKTRDEVAEALYTQLCHEIRSMSMFEMLAAKKGYEAQLPLNRAPANVQARVQRITSVVLAKVLG